MLMLVFFYYLAEICFHFDIKKYFPVDHCQTREHFEMDVDSVLLNNKTLKLPKG